MAKEGCDLNGNGYPYPYVLLTKDGTDLEDEKEYTVVICGFLKGMEDELNQQAGKEQAETQAAEKSREWHQGSSSRRLVRLM